MYNKPHPMGEIVPGKYFAFVEEIKECKYHTLVLENDNEEDARKSALDIAENGNIQLMTVGVVHREVRIKPVREKHNV